MSTFTYMMNLSIHLHNFVTNSRSQLLYNRLTGMLFFQCNTHLSFKDLLIHRVADRYKSIVYASSFCWPHRSFISKWNQKPEHNKMPLVEQRERIERSEFEQHSAIHKAFRNIWKMKHKKSIKENWWEIYILWQKVLHNRKIFHSRIIEMMIERNYIVTAAAWRPGPSGKGFTSILWDF